MLPPESSGCIDVSLLILLRSSADQMHLCADLTNVDTVSRAEIDSQLTNSLSDRLNIAQVSIFDTINTAEDDRLYLRAKSSQPFSERLPAIVVLTNQNLSRNRFHVNSLAEPA
jgi:hypothetical protein